LPRQESHALVHGLLDGLDAHLPHGGGAPRARGGPRGSGAGGLLRRDREPDVPPGTEGGAMTAADALAVPAPARDTSVPGASSPEEALRHHLEALVHSWSKTVTVLGFTLVPLFFVLDAVMMPRPLLRQFGVYRLVTTLIVFGQYFVLHYTRPSRYSRF